MNKTFFILILFSILVIGNVIAWGTEAAQGEQKMEISLTYMAIMIMVTILSWTVFKSFMGYRQRTGMLPIMFALIFSFLFMWMIYPSLGLDGTIEGMMGLNNMSQADANEILDNNEVFQDYIYVIKQDHMILDEQSHNTTIIDVFNTKDLLSEDLLR